MSNTAENQNPPQISAAAVAPADGTRLKLGVLGASGRTGTEVVRQALEAGHQVTVLVRDPAKLGELEDRVRVIQGDATDAAAVSELVAGQDAVVNALGQVKGGPPDLMAVNARHLVAAMQEHGVKRVALLSGAGIRVAQDHPSLSGRAIAWALGRMIAAQIADGRAQMDVLQAAPGLEWVVVRATTLTDGPLTGSYRLGYPNRGPGAKISRADVAHALLGQLTTGAWARQAPAIQY